MLSSEQTACLVIRVASMHTIFNIDSVATSITYFSNCDIVVLAWKLRVMVINVYDPVTDTGRGLLDGVMEI